MILYTTGCSHSVDFPVENPKDIDHQTCFSWPIKLMDMLSQNYKNIRNFKPISQSHFNSDYDLLINSSVSGASNDYILSEALENITYLISINQKPDLVVIQWSGPNRRFHMEPNGDRFFVNPTEHLDYFLKFEPMGSTHTLHYILTLQEFLKSKDIKYRFINYFDLDNSVKNLNAYQNVDFENFVVLDKNDITIGFLDYIKKNGFNRDAEGHPNKKGYEQIAKLIFDTLNK